MKTDDEWLKESFEANCLDGDAVQEGQMLASTYVLEFLLETVLPHSQAKELKGRQDELQEASDHWWNCDGDKCEFSAGNKGCGYDEHRQTELLHQLQQLKNGES